MREARARETRLGNEVIFRGGRRASGRIQGLVAVDVGIVWGGTCGGSGQSRDTKAAELGKSIVSCHQTKVPDEKHQNKKANGKSNARSNDRPIAPHNLRLPAYIGSP